MDAAEQAVAAIVEARKGKPKRKAAKPNAPKKAPKEANLKPPWKPGQSGNPTGMKPGTVSLTAILKRKLAEAPEGETRTRAEILVDATLRDAVKGDSAARKLAWEYVEGAARQTIDMAATIEVSCDGARERLAGAIARIAAAASTSEGAAGSEAD